MFDELDRDRDLPPLVALAEDGDGPAVEVEVAELHPAELGGAAARLDHRQDAQLLNQREIHPAGRGDEQVELVLAPEVVIDRRCGCGGSFGSRSTGLSGRIPSATAHLKKSRQADVLLQQRRPQLQQLRHAAPPHVDPIVSCTAAAAGTSVIDSHLRGRSPFPAVRVLRREGLPPSHCRTRGASFSMDAELVLTVASVLIGGGIYLTSVVACILKGRYAMLVVGILLFVPVLLHRPLPAREAGFVLGEEVLRPHQTRPFGRAVPKPRGRRCRKCGSAFVVATASRPSRCRQTSSCSSVARSSSSPSGHSSSTRRIASRSGISSATIRASRS